MCDHVEYLRIDCGNAHGTLERRRLQYTLQAVIFPTDMWKQYSLQNNLQAVIFPTDLQFLFLLVWIDNIRQTKTTFKYSLDYLAIREK